MILPSVTCVTTILRNVPKACPSQQHASFYCCLVFFATCLLFFICFLFWSLPVLLAVACFVLDFVVILCVQFRTGWLLLVI